MVLCLRFFLGIDKSSHKQQENEESELPTLEAKRTKLSMIVGGKTKAKESKLKRAMASMRKHERKTKNVGNYNFSAASLLNDAHQLAETLFSCLTSKDKNETFEVKCLLMNFISRLVGIHKLILPNLYSFFIKYLQPHQLDVTKIIVYAAQASHEIVPPEECIYPLILSIANNFVNEGCSDEVITVGLNGIREISSRCPLSMTEALLRDLAMYKSYKNKGYYL